TAAAGSATASASSAALSQQWAENPEDVPVMPGLFSAHHWANKAAALVASISSLYTRMTAVELRATNLEYSYISSQQSFTANGTVTLAHGLGAVPSRVSMDMVCVTAELGFSVGDVIPIGESAIAISASSVSFGVQNRKTATQIISRIASGGILVISIGTGAASSVTPSFWRIVFKASKS
ncbi:hypothetical protein, partial [Pseudomonas gingeri]|uniref:hypothetical protein n=1 Tax=Pseudomonas gingeri TaxID=117681 RepID=UPI0015A06D7F